MPTYDYKCDACDHQWEEFQSIKAEPTKKCPKCGKSKAKRQISCQDGILSGSQSRFGQITGKALRS